MSAPIHAIHAPNQYVEVNNRKLAYRSMGAGRAIILCCRFRGNMDSWDPEFLDTLAGQGFRVITFDYSGLGLSGGTPTYNPLQMSSDPLDLATALGLEQAVIAGWSLGGIVAQVVLARQPAWLTHAVLIATTPPGPLAKPAEQLFYDLARKEENTLEDETALFFEPASARSREAARRSAARIAARHAGRSVPVPAAWAASNIGDKPNPQPFPAPQVLEALKRTSIPLLHIGGDHDIIFPVENWYALNGQLPTLELFTYPSAGHGPQHQHPRAAADYIGSFVRNTGAA
jgi:pimeloyl-ACP methyl ester carboxylesterase